jgi:hypothetical protein
MKEEKSSKANNNNSLIDTNKETKNYYLENGYVVFTEAYHLARGSCCGSGCRHCPYKKKKN